MTEHNRFLPPLSARKPRFITSGFAPTKKETESEPAAQQQKPVVNTPVPKERKEPDTFKPHQDLQKQALALKTENPLVPVCIKQTASPQDHQLTPDHQAESPRPSPAESTLFAQRMKQNLESLAVYKTPLKED